MKTCNADISQLHELLFAIISQVKLLYSYENSLKIMFYKKGNIVFSDKFQVLVLVFNFIHS